MDTVCYVPSIRNIDPNGEGVGQRRFIRSDQKDIRMKIFIWVQTLTTVLFTVWLFYVWIKDIDFGSQKSCNHLVKYVLFFADVKATATWLRVLFIMNLVISACTLLFRFGAILSDHMARLRKKMIRNMNKEVRDVIARADPRESQESRELQESIEPQEQGSTSGETKHRYISPSVVYVPSIISV